MSYSAQPNAVSEGPAQLTVVGPSRPAARDVAPGQPARPRRLDLEPFAVDVQRGAGVTIVQPRGDLDLATAGTLRSALDAAIAETLGAALGGIEGAARLVLDLRGLSFIDSTGLHLLVALRRRAQRDGFKLTLVAPAAPIDRAIRLAGLDQELPFAALADASIPNRILAREY